MEIVKGEPLKLPDGTIILPEVDEATGSKVVTKDQQEQKAAQEQVNKELSNLLTDPINNEYSDLYKRTLADVEVDYARMNVTMLVLTYTLWGLDSYAISRVLGVTIDQVDALKETDLYARTQQQVIEAIRYAEAATVHGYLDAKANAAARVVAASLTNPSGDLRLAAAKDILDRAGFRPADRIEHSVKFEDELRIRYVRDEADIPTININAGEV